MKLAGYHHCLSIYTIIPVAIENITVTHYTNIAQPPNQAHVVAVIHPSNNSRVSTYAASNLIINPDYPAMEPLPREYRNCIFDR